MAKKIKKDKEISNKDIPVVILCGGQGTRLREETEFKPKPLVEIGGRPVLWHIMKIYSHYGFRRFILCLGYKGEMIKDYFLNYRTRQNNFTIGLKENKISIYDQDDIEDWEITMVDTGKTAETGTRVKRIENYVNSDVFLLTYGDGVANVDMAKLLKFHRSHGKLGTVTGALAPSRYGELMTEDNLVVRFSEKPQLISADGTGFISGGYFVLNKKFFDYLRDEDNCYLEGEALHNLATDRELAIYRHDGFWQCMDTYRENLLLNRLWENGRPWAVWENE